MPSSVPTDAQEPASRNGQSTPKSKSTEKPQGKRVKSSDKGLSARRLSDLLPGSPMDGGPLRWGLAAALGRAVDDKQLALSELGCGNSLPKKLRSFDLVSELNVSLLRIDEAMAPPKPQLSCLVEAVMWAYALPNLQSLVGEAESKSLRGSLDQLVRHCIMIPDHSSLARLIGGGELGLVLAWQSRRDNEIDFLSSSVECVRQWCDSLEPSIGFAVQGGFPASFENGSSGSSSGSHMRVVLASLIRTRAMVELVTRRKLKKSQVSTIGDLATWVTAATRVGGTTAFSKASSRDVRDDTVRGGLLDQLKKLDPETLGPALDAAAGRSHTGGRIAWEISLPEAFCHSELGGTAIFLPEWDVRRGRMHLDYGGADVRLQIDAGKMNAIDGTWELLIQVDGQEQAAAGPWTSLCEYTDDDVHYLELEQRWSGDIKVQRHLLLIREDRCVLLADAVVRDPSQPPAHIGYTARIKLADGVTAAKEKETTEVWLQDASGERRGLALSLQSNEWRVGPSRASVDVTADGNLRLEAHSDKRNSHGGSIFAPLWLDFQQRRFKRPRTWRQLTVAEELRIVDPDEAVAFRIQQGSEQWVIYRLLHGDRTRTFLGKHLLADLYCARFHASDGNMEDLVTVGGVDDEEEEEDSTAK